MGFTSAKIHWMAFVCSTERSLKDRRLQYPGAQTCRMTLLRSSYGFKSGSKGRQCIWDQCTRWGTPNSFLAHIPQPEVYTWDPEPKVLYLLIHPSRFASMCWWRSCSLLGNCDALWLCKDRKSWVGLQTPGLNTDLPMGLPASSEVSTQMPHTYVR